MSILLHEHEPSIILFTHFSARQESGEERVLGRLYDPTEEVSPPSGPVTYLEIRAFDRFNKPSVDPETSRSRIVA